jgi:hypothetical protein
MEKAHHVLHDEIYNCPEIHAEKKKFQNINSAKNIEINQTRQKIKEKKGESENGKNGSPNININRTLSAKRNRDNLQRNKYNLY